MRQPNSKNITIKNVIQTKISLKQKDTKTATYDVCKKSKHVKNFERYTKSKTCLIFASAIVEDKSCKIVYTTAKHIELSRTEFCFGN